MYQSGNFASGDGFDQVCAKLVAFAQANGWTASGAYPKVTLDKDSVHASLTFDTSVLVDDSKNTGAQVPDYRIESYLSNAALNGVDGGVYPASMVGYPAVANDFTGPYSRYWLFSGAAGDPDYLYMVVQKLNGRFCTFMIGKLDQKGIGYDGGEFVNGVFWQWWFFGNSEVSSFAGSDTGSDMQGADHGFPGDLQPRMLNLRIGGDIAKQCDPANPNAIFIGPAAFATPYSVDRLAMLNRRGKPAKVEDLTSDLARWLGHTYFLGPNPVNGISPMFEVFEALQDKSNLHYIYAGAYPGYRAISMLGRIEAEQVTFGSDNYIVFPIKRYLPFSPEPFQAKIVTSGPYGHAFKVNN